MNFIPNKRYRRKQKSFSNDSGSILRKKGITTRKDCQVRTFHFRKLQSRK